MQSRNLEQLILCFQEAPAPFKCSQCPKTFSKETLLTHHVKTAHSNGAAKQWECGVCKKTFTTKYFLKKHNRL